jgi:hypothetical protein
MMNEIILRPDSKGRLNISDFAKGVSSFRVNLEKNGQIILEPYAEIPFEDKWIFEDKDLLEKIKQQYAQEKAA